jgi:flagellar biosynthesis chaperone FliJ
MKTIKFISIIAIATLVFCACGGKKEQQSTVVETTEQAQISSSSSTTSSETTTSTTTKDWDSVLDQYETFVDDYVNALKKASKGDMSVYADMESLMEKAEELGDELDDVKNELTPSQAKRYMSILEKMTNAAADMSSTSIENAKEIEESLDDYEEALNSLEDLDLDF